MGLAETCSLFLYSDMEDKLRALAEHLILLDPALQSHLVPRAGSKKKWCLALAFSTPFLAASLAPAAGCPEGMLREEVCRRPACELSPAQVVAASRDLVAAVTRAQPDLALDAVVPAHHEPTFAAATGDLWALLSLDDAFVQRLRAYHGEDVGAYFLFLTSYQHWLLPAGLLGVLLFFLPLGVAGTRFKDLVALALPPGVSPLYGFALPVWMVFALKLWGWSQDKVKGAWVQPALQLPQQLQPGGSSSGGGGGGGAANPPLSPAQPRAAATPARPGPRPHGAAAAAASNDEPWGATQGIKMLCLAVPLALYAGASFFLFLQCEAIGQALGSPLLNTFLQMAVNWFFAEFTAQTVAEQSVDFVTGRRNSSTYESLQLRIELLLSQVIIQSPFIHMAFVERDMAGVRWRLLGLLGFKSFVLDPLQQRAMPWLQTNVLPHLSYAWVVERVSQVLAARRKPGAEAEAAAAAAAAAEAASEAAEAAEAAANAAAFAAAHPHLASGTGVACYPPLSRPQLRALKRAAHDAFDMPAFSPDEEHKQLFKQLALIALWGAVFPLAPLCCFLSNFMELWVDSAKLLSLRRCTFGGQGAEGLMEREAKWSAVLKGVAYLACAVNAALMVAGEAGLARHVGGGGLAAPGLLALGGSSGGWGAATLSSVSAIFVYEHVAFAAIMAVEVALPERFFLTLTAPPAAGRGGKRRKGE
jgi:hypothetical protein